jgi:ribosomal protein S18 acetylase RimI-like enzyme
VNVRPAQPNDVPAVLPLVRKVAAFHQALDPAKYSFKSDPGELYRAWLMRKTSDELAVFLVADVAAAGEPPRVVGFLIGTVEAEIPIYTLREFGFVHDLWVEDDYRHEGIGRQLVMQAIERFSEIGVAQVRLDVLERNEPARNLFAACGFRASAVEMIRELTKPD